MFSAKTRRKLGIGAGALLLCLLLWNPVARAILAVRMALSLQELASGASAQSLPIAEASAQRQFQGQEYEALIYLPTNASATKAIILVAGLSELGCRHPRLIALARVLAEKGLMVVTQTDSLLGRRRESPHDGTRGNIFFRNARLNDRGKTGDPRQCRIRRGDRSIFRPYALHS
jgi:poly(3-hydroxybutyrate) depolymerase